MKKLLVSAVLSCVVTSPVFACATVTCPTGTYTVNYITNNYVTNNYYGDYYEDCTVYDYDYTYNYDCDTYDYYDYDYDYDYYDCDYEYDISSCVGAYEESADDYEEEFYNYYQDYYEDSYNYSSCSYSYESEYYEDYNCGYSENYYGTVMCHWANLRDAEGNIIGCLQGGDKVAILGQCADNPSRTLIYDACTGTYGTVASVYLYGGTAYEYENPTEWSGYYDYSYSESNTDAVVYTETDTWAADDMTWLEEECYSYGQDNNYEYYEYDYTYCDDDDEVYSCTDASGSYWYDDSDYEEDDDDCGLIWGECRTITNNYWVDVDISSNTVNFVNNGTVIFVGSYNDIKNIDSLGCGEYSCDDVKLRKKFCAEIEDYTCDEWCVKVHE